MTKIENRFKGMMLVSLGVAVLDILIGILFIAYTSFTVNTNLVIIGSLLLVHGLFFLIRYIYDGFGKKVFAVDLVAAVASLILASFAFFNEMDPLDVIGKVFCVWLVINGSQKMYFAIKLMKKQDSVYPLVTFISILLLVMGVISFINPFDSFMVITRLVGLFLICSGVLESMICSLFRKKASTILDMFKA